MLRCQSAYKNISRPRINGTVSPSQPTLTEPATPADLPSTSALVFPHLFVIRDETQVYPRANNYVDVRDAAEVHARALEVEAAGGQRIAAVSRAYSAVMLKTPI